MPRLLLLSAEGDRKMHCLHVRFVAISVREGPNTSQEGFREKSHG
jgi:hypothetical protein